MMDKSVAMVTCVLTIFIGAQSGSAKEPAGPWAREIPSQPFEREPFFEIAVPRWVQQTGGVGYTLSGMSFEQRRKAVEAGVTIGELGFVDPFYAYYESNLLKKRSPYVPPDKLRHDIEEYTRLGIRILAVYPPTLQSEVYENHPDWRRISERTTQIPSVDLKRQPFGGPLCLLGPYGDYMIDVLAEILTKFPKVDAFSFDGLSHGGFCYCEHCRKNYKRDTGKDIPTINLNDPEYRRYQHWADRRLEDMVRRMQRRLKSIRPDVALITWSTNAGRWGHLLSIPRNMPARLNLLFDAPDEEFWMDEVNRGATIVPAFGCAYAWAVSNHRVSFCEPYLMSHGNPYGKDSFPPQEIYRRMMMVVTYGCAPSIAVGQPPRLQQAVYEAIRDVRKLGPWMSDKEPEKWAAVVMSDNTRNFYPRESGAAEDRYLSNVFGVFRTAVEEHLPVTLINDWNLKEHDLKGYRVLVMPNTACLDDRQVEAVTKFVERGGGLVASIDVSAFNEFGDHRPNFALRKVLGVSRGAGALAATADDREIDPNFLKGIGPDYWEKRKSIFDFRVTAGSELASNRLRGYLDENEPITFKGQAVAVAADGPEVKVAGTLAGRGTASPAQSPGVLMHKFGQGRVVYFAAGFDSAYYLYSYPYQRVLLRNAIEWAAGGSSPISVSAPMCVHTTFFRQHASGKDRLLVHLFNDVDTAARHALPNDDTVLREETLPVHDIDIHLRDYAVREAFEEPAHRPLELRHEGQTVIVRVPKLEVHDLIVLDLADQPDLRPR